MSEGKASKSSVIIAASLVGAVVAALLFAFLAGWLIFKREPPPPPVKAGAAAAQAEAGQKAPLPAPKLHRLANWIYFRGADIRSNIDKLADFDIVVAPLAAGDGASIGELASRGCLVIAEEPKFGGLLNDERGEKTVAKIPGAVCWIGADFSDPSNKILSQENKKTIEALREYAAAHPGEKVLVFASELPRDKWEMFRHLMMRFGFVPCAGPADAASIYDFVHESAAAVPRPVQEG